MPADSEFWSTKADVSFISDVWSLKGATLCFNTLLNEFIQLPANVDYCETVHKIICNGKYGTDCTKDKADFKKAPILSI